MKVHEFAGQFQKLNRLRGMITPLIKHLVSERLIAKKSSAVVMRKVVEDLGTTYIKFGQWLSVRPDFAPPEVIQELEKLQDKLNPVRFEIIKRTIERELGEPIDKTFAELDPTPLSTASIAQVHRGILKTGQKIVVKVQRPKLKQLIAVDFSVLRSMMKWAVGNWPHLSLHRPDDFLFSFKATLMNELDFTIEAKNQDRMAQVFADTPWLRIPKIYWKYTTERLMVMEYLHGLKLGEQERFDEWGLDRKVLAERLSDCMFRQIFESGFFHSDPHPGNILYMKDNQIGLIDFGIMAKLTDTLLDKFLDWFYAIIYRDVDRLADTFLEVGEELAAIDKIQFRNDCMDYIDEMHFQPAERISFAKVFTINNRILYQHKISVPPTFLFIFKAITTLEGVLREMDRKYDWRDEWGPRIRKIVRDRYSPAAILKYQGKLLQDYNRLTADFPADLREVMKKMKEGKIENEVRLPELGSYVAEIKKAVNKLSVSLVVSAVILGMFHLGRGQGDNFLRTFIGQFDDYWWAILSLILIALYFLRKR